MYVRLCTSEQPDRQLFTKPSVESARLKFDSPIENSSFDSILACEHFQISFSRDSSSRLVETKPQYIDSLRHVQLKEKRFLILVYNLRLVSVCLIKSQVRTNICKSNMQNCSESCNLSSFVYLGQTTSLPTLFD